MTGPAASAWCKVQGARVDRRRLPIGIQTFREIREEDCYYVDKTPLVYRLAAEGKHYFLSRPRRLSKSLLLDTFKELFEGSEALFEGLHVHDRWDWSVRHPVVRLSFGAGHFKEPGHLEANISSRWSSAATRATWPPSRQRGHSARGSGAGKPGH